MSEERKRLSWVGWNSVCKHKLKYGFGIVDLQVQNRALLHKWIWRYNEENEGLWRVVIQERNGGNPLELIPCVSESKMTSKMLKKSFSLYPIVTIILIFYLLVWEWRWATIVTFYFGRINGLRVSC